MALRPPAPARRPAGPSQPAPARHTRAAATLSNGPRSSERALALRRAASGSPGGMGRNGRTGRTGRRWGTIAFLAAMHLLAVVALLPRFWSLPALATLLLLTWITACLGVTLGYHRLLSHRSFQVPRWLERFLATCGALSCQHGPIDWVGLHRHHHKFSDTDADHHNSHRGFWWSHLGWMLEAIPARAAVPRLSGDLARDPYYRWLNRWFLLPQLLLALLLLAIGAHSGAGGWGLLLWGIPLRLVLVYHCTWLVNSATHRWGQVSHASGDNSRNNAWVAALTFGEGWHNNHHAFPHSARHGFGRSQLDLTWLHIRLLQRLGLATRVRLPQGARRENQEKFNRPATS